MWSFEKSDITEIMKFWAPVYDDLLPPLPVDDPMVEMLGQIAQGGPVLELGVGSGRVAVPLAARGLTVDGVDLSREMLDQLRAKSDTAKLRAIEGDFVTLPFPQKYALIFAVQITFEALGSCEQQIKCIENVARHLRDDGHFVLEAFAPAGLFGQGRHDILNVDSIDLDSMRLSAMRHRPIDQSVEFAHLVINHSGVNYLPAYFRYVWPSELDLMASAHGLTLKSRWGGWSQETYDASSFRYISVYARTSTA